MTKDEMLHDVEIMKKVMCMKGMCSLCRLYSDCGGDILKCNSILIAWLKKHETV